MNDVDLAATLADAAGKLLLDMRNNHNGGDLGNEADRAANDLLCDALAVERPDDALLSEERVCDGGRVGRSRVWIIDPLDGTREYADGRDDWAVHVALCVNGLPIVGAVALPCQGITYRSDAPPSLGKPNVPPVMVVSRSRPPQQTQRVANALGASVAPMGSAGAKAMAVVRGTADVYLHSGGQYEWDSAAPVAVALAAGLHCARLDGSPLVYNRANPYIPDLLICRQELVGAITAALREDS